MPYGIKVKVRNNMRSKWHGCGLCVRMKKGRAEKTGAIQGKVES